jgi:GGDEF domain-containing protein
MNRKFVAAFAAVCIAAALLSATSVAYRLLAGDAAGRRAAKADFEGLRSVLAYVKTTSDLADPSLRARLASRYEANPSLLLVDVYERGAGDRWRIPADSPYLSGVRQEGAVPELVYPPSSTILLSSPLKGDSSGQLAVDALYTSLTQLSVFSAFRDALIGLGVFLSLTALILAFISGTGDVRMASQAVRTTSAIVDPPEKASVATATDLAAAAAEYQYDTLMSEKEEQEAPSSTGISIKSSSRRGEELDIPNMTPECGDKPEGLYSPSSSLGWESYMQERLDAEISRSASLEQDLSLLFFSFDGLSAPDPNYAAIGAAIKDFFNFRDLSFERGGDGFSVILPSIDSIHALRMAEEFYRKLVFLTEGDFARLGRLPIFMGISSRSGRLVDALRMAEEAEAALDKARYEKDTHMVAFRPDPDKYRHFLASKAPEDKENGNDK